MDDRIDLPCIDEDGNVTNYQMRFWELLDICVNTFAVDLLAQIAVMRSEGKKIVTVEIVGYDKHILKLVIQTK